MKSSIFFFLERLDVLTVATFMYFILIFFSYYIVSICLHHCLHLDFVFRFIYDCKLSVEILTYRRNVIKFFKQHGISDEHKNRQMLLLNRCNSVGRIDRALREYINKETAHRKTVLKRVVTVVRQLGSRRLPFRGSVDKFESQK